MTFLATPYPERIARLNLRQPDEPQDMLSIGLQEIATTPDGLKIRPCVALVVAFGKTIGEPEERAIDVSIPSARIIAKRIIDMCDHAETLPNAWL